MFWEEIEGVRELGEEGWEELVLDVGFCQGSGSRVGGKAHVRT